MESVFAWIGVAAVVVLCVASLLAALSNLLFRWNNRQDFYRLNLLIGQASTLGRWCATDDKIRETADSIVRYGQWINTGGKQGRLEEPDAFRTRMMPDFGKRLSTPADAGREEQ